MEEIVRSLIKLAFFLWLAIAAGTAWITDDMTVAGLISKAVLCGLAFFGGVAGVAWTIYSEARGET